MFTGIIETIGEILSITVKGDNLQLEVESVLTPELKIDQSLAHNGVCLTVEEVREKSYIVTAIKETLEKSNLANLKIGDHVNLERAMILGDRLDGHIVQGHVDQVGNCRNIKEENGSWIFTFDYDSNFSNITVEKGSVTINGVSLTVFNSSDNQFSVAIIPYTYNNTNFKQIKIGTLVNIEFDIVGKYVKRLVKGVD